MIREIQAEKAPLRITDSGIFVGKTRIRLEMIVEAFHQGETPERIVDDYDVLKLADVYAVIAYYLNHREEVDAYVKERHAAAETMYKKIERERPEMLTLQKRLQTLKYGNDHNHSSPDFE